ncbi:MAG: hypothetical protein EKK55_18335 [Rhodocyclaceae bacterium]|nr:MAG: hypothetical protein EKK55_18335 [Rhodocyclaceae bacterium]
MADQAPTTAPPGALGIMGLPERALRQSLAFGFDYLAEHPELLVFLGFTDEDERTRLVASGALKPVVRVGYPFAQAGAPVVTVMTLSESPAQSYLGDTAGGGLIQLRDQIIGIHAVATHPDVVLYLYRAIDQILFSHMDWYMSGDGAGFDRVEWQDGGEFIPEFASPDQSTRLFGRMARVLVTSAAGAVLHIPAPATHIDVHLAPDGGLLNVEI